MLSLHDNIVLHVDTMDDLRDLEDTLADEHLRDQLVMLNIGFGFFLKATFSQNICKC